MITIFELNYLLIFLSEEHTKNIRCFFFFFEQKQGSVVSTRSLTYKLIRGSHPELFYLLYILYKGSSISVKCADIYVLHSRNSDIC